MIAFAANHMMAPPVECPTERRLAAPGRLACRQRVCLQQDDSGEGVDCHRDAIVAIGRAFRAATDRLGADDSMKNWIPDDQVDEVLQLPGPGPAHDHVITR